MMESKKLEKKVCSRLDYVRENLKWEMKEFEVLANSERLPERIVGRIDKIIIYPIIFGMCYFTSFFDRGYRSKD